MSRRRRLSEEERALWSGFARSIRPLQRTAATDPSNGPSETEPPTPAPIIPRVASPPPQSVPPPLAAPLDRRHKRRVARGRDAIDARIDLHGMTQREAHAALLHFLHGAQAGGAKIVLVVTGKGTGRTGTDTSGERGVLRRQVPLWLSLPEFSRFIVGFEEAHVSHGGQGALYLRLRRAR